MKCQIIKTLILASAVSAAAPARAVDVTDMVLVPSSSPFYLDIFETSCGTAQRVNNSCNFGSQNWKPARINAEQASDICRRQGKRLPTLDEWRTAASDVGRNQSFTLIGDSLYDASGRLKALIRGNASAGTTDFGALGIDAVGTVGLTGNRYEWVTTGNPQSPWAQCGGQYETRDDNDVRLSNICITDPSRFVRDATARCALDYSTDVRVVYSNSVTGRLKDYLATVADRPLPVGDELDEILIPQNSFTGLDPEDPVLLELPKPYYDDEY